ncbi:MAG: metallophosphoesterase [Proteobacteria bacterium]|nr:metallophosphoesterase [Pseudomonadota bacterium]
MTVRFIHLSDIHFGQEKGGQIVVNDDVKYCLIKDAAKQIEALAPDGTVSGIIVSGDIAFAGKENEYAAAAKWLDNLASALNLLPTDVIVVPGNHDIDRDEITPGCRLMIAHIAESGENALDDFLKSDLDRELLYSKFKSYRPFAEGYNCSLDAQGGNAGTRSVQISEGRNLRIIGLNSALLCSTHDKEGQLLLGKRQRVLPPPTSGEELIVICHHPLKWLQDSEDAGRYVRSRARVLITGHEHSPSVRMETTPQGTQILHIEAGAAMPPQANEKYNYTYNILEISWDASTDGLAVYVHSRTWNDELKKFVKREDAVKHILKCENFERNDGPSGATTTVPVGAPQAESAMTVRLTETASGGVVVTDAHALLLLRYFRDLSSAQRIRVLVCLGALPENWDDALSHAMERQVLDRLLRQGRADEIDREIERVRAT